MSLTAERHDPRFEPVRAILRNVVRTGVTPGVQLSVQWQATRAELASERWDYAEGRLSYAPDAPTVSVTTLYDLASVTKAIIALAAVRVAHRDGIDLGAPLASF